MEETRLQLGDFVQVKRTRSLPVEHFGTYGKIIEVRENGKVKVEFAAKSGPIGSLNRLADPSDLVKVGHITD